jgi:hypothetical protein
MKEQLIDDDLVRKFLLGQVSQQEEDEIAASMFEDPDSFSRLESIEDELIDEFLQEELTPAEKKGFETHFLKQPGRSRNLKLSRALRQYFDKEDVAAVVPAVPVVVPADRVSVFGLFTISRPVFRLSFVGAILIGVVIAVWLYVRVREPQRPPVFEAHKEESASPSPSITSSPTIEPSPTVSPGENKNSATPAPRKHERPLVYAQVLLPLGSTRSRAQSLKLPSTGPNVPVESSGVSVPVRLGLASETRYDSYDVTLQSDNGSVLKSWSTLREKRLNSGKSLVISIPLDLLKPQQLYRIIVTGRSADGTVHNVHRYEFQVSNNP